MTTSPEQLRRWHQGKQTGRSLAGFADGSVVLVDGEPVPVGLARQGIARAQGWQHIVISTGDGVVSFSDLYGRGRVVLPLASPREG